MSYEKNKAYWDKRGGKEAYEAEVKRKAKKGIELTDATKESKSLYNQASNGGRNHFENAQQAMNQAKQSDGFSGVLQGNDEDGYKALDDDAARESNPLHDVNKKRQSLLGTDGYKEFDAQQAPAHYLKNDEGELEHNKMYWSGQVSSFMAAKRDALAKGNEEQAEYWQSRVDEAAGKMKKAPGQAHYTVGVNNNAANASKYGVERPTLGWYDSKWNDPQARDSGIFGGPKQWDENPEFNQESDYAKQYQELFKDPTYDFSSQSNFTPFDQANLNSAPEGRRSGFSTMDGNFTRTHPEFGTLGYSNLEANPGEAIRYASDQEGGRKITPSEAYSLMQIAPGYQFTRDNEGNFYYLGPSESGRETYENAVSQSAAQQADNQVSQVQGGPVNLPPTRQNGNHTDTLLQMIKNSLGY